MMQKVILLSVCVFLISANLVAQEQNDSVKTRKAQVTFVYPLGSSGVNSMK